MARTPKPRSPAWWNKHEQRLRNFIDANPSIADMTFTEVYHGIGGSSIGGCIPKAELASLCRLLRLTMADFPVAH